MSNINIAAQTAVAADIGAGIWFIGAAAALANNPAAEKGVLEPRKQFMAAVGAARAAGKHGAASESRLESYAAAHKLSAAVVKLRRSGHNGTIPMWDSSESASMGCLLARQTALELHPDCVEANATVILRKYASEVERRVINAAKTKAWGGVAEALSFEGLVEFLAGELKPVATPVAAPEAPAPEAPAPEAATPEAPAPEAPESDASLNGIDKSEQTLAPIANDAEYGRELARVVAYALNTPGLGLESLLERIQLHAAAMLSAGNPKGKRAAKAAGAKPVTINSLAELDSIIN